MEHLPSAPQITTVVIAQLCRAPEFQIRRKLCPRTVSRYAAVIKSGKQLPPLQVALVDKVPCLVDGYHRAAALEELGYSNAEAIITETSRDQAQWMAAKANMEHGLPLTSREIREAFRVYIRTEQHRKGRGKLKSYREIGQELGRSHNTIRNWMEQDFKELFNRYGGSNNSQGIGEEGIPLRKRPPRGAEPALGHIAQLRKAFQETSCPLARDAIRQAVKEATDEILKDWQEPESDF